MNNGRMDGFIAAERSADTMAYYDRSDLPNYWTYADHFTLCDRFFSSLAGPSLPNHLYTIAAQSGGVLNNMKKPPSGGFNFPTMAELLGRSNVTWKYYNGEDPAEFGVWSPLPGFASFMKSEELRSHIVSSTEYFQDLRGGTLPAVSWIVPNAPNSEHPPSDLGLGMWYVTDLVNALMKSPYWLNTVLVITWDDYGGFYDHVAPPQVDGYGYGPTRPHSPSVRLHPPGQHRPHHLRLHLSAQDDRGALPPRPADEPRPQGPQPPPQPEPGPEAPPAPRHRAAAGLNALARARPAALPKCRDLLP